MGENAEELKTPCELLTKNERVLASSYARFSGEEQVVKLIAALLKRVIF